MTFEDLLGYVKAAGSFNQSAEGRKFPIFFDAYDMPSMEVLFQNLVKSSIGRLTPAAAAEQSDRGSLKRCIRGLGG